MKNLFFVIFCSLSFALPAQNFDPDVVYGHIKYLASDKLKGRYPGTKGETKAANYIIKGFQKAGLAPKGSAGWLQPFTWKDSANPHEAHGGTGALRNGKNVVGFLDNGATKTIVIGAHYDHLGLGHDHNSLDANPEGKIHNGADDNASGIAGLIELAAWLKNDKSTKAFNYLFIAFSGEESGLIGSKRWCETPTIPLANIHAMLNMDMIGRLDPARGLVVGGVGTAAPLFDLVERVPHVFKVVRDSSGQGPSDHTSFYLKNIPVLFFFTGAHSDYHKPTDDIEKVNTAGLTAILTYIGKVIVALNKENLLAFTPTRAPQMGTASSFKVTLGIMPDYGFDGPGVRADGVTEGKPAFKAGVLAGDIIMKLGSLEIGNIYSYMDALATFKSGDATQVVVNRAGALKTLDIIFQ